MNRSHLDTELRLIKDGLLAMAGVAEEMIRLTIRAYSEKLDSMVGEVLRMGASMDEMEVRLDQACIDLLALQSPMGSDLRFATSAIKILPDIERIGDHCENIARRAPLLNHLQRILPQGLLEALGGETSSMMRRSVEAFVASDAALARSVIDSDDKVDDIYNHCYRELVRQMVSDPLCVERASHLIIVIKNWERIGDMATNIAEEVIFIAEGVNAKHLRKQEGRPVEWQPEWKAEAKTEGRAE
jgi:phosphate transport system protein